MNKDDFLEELQEQPADKKFQILAKAEKEASEA